MPAPNAAEGRSTRAHGRPAHREIGLRRVHRVEPIARREAALMIAECVDLHRHTGAVIEIEPEDSADALRNATSETPSPSAVAAAIAFCQRDK
jgi:hypothetical protein